MEEELNTEEKKPHKTILLVDDDEIHLLFTELLLNDEYEIFTVKSGKEALKLLDKKHDKKHEKKHDKEHDKKHDKKHIVPDLIMLDVMMPEMDGWEVFNKIKKIAALKSTPIMFFSSMEDKSARKKAHEIGASDFVIKPCDQTDLLNRIKDVLKKAKHKKEKKDK